MPLVMDRFDPEPGTYRAKLVAVDRYTNSKGQLGVRLKWQLLSHPDKHSIFYAFSHYSLANTGLISRLTYHWKGMLWADVLGLQAADGRHAPERFIGDEADVLVVPHVNQNGENRTHVSDVAPAGTYVAETQPGIYVLTGEGDD